MNPEDTRIPKAVSLITNRCAKPLNLLLVQNRYRVSNRQYRLTACIGPLHSSYSDVNRLIETVEVDNILGVDLVVLYNFSMSSSLDPYVRSFNEDGLVDYYNWYNPVLYRTHYYGQRLLINDCMFRYMYQSDYIIVKDIDETVVPRGAYTSLINLLKDLPTNRIAEYNIRQVVFPDFLKNGRPRVWVAKDLYMRTLIKTNRTAFVWPHQSRSKYIVNPRRLVQGDIHSSGVLLGNNQVYNIPEDQALVHHYRRHIDIVREFLNDTVIDKRLYIYHDEIVKRITARHALP